MPEFFRDPREGSDRWGTPRQRKWGCGPSLDKACPAYLDESCPGFRNPGNRLKPPEKVHAPLACDLSGSLRVPVTVPADVAHSSVPPALPVRYFPVVERNAPDAKHGTMMDAVNPLPVVGTTAKSAWHALHGRLKLSLRERIGCPADATLVLNGMVPDDLLNKVWEYRKPYLQFCRDEGVDVMIDPQFTATATSQNYTAIVNTTRVFNWHLEALSMGFQHVVLQHPGPQAQWLLDEYYAFAHQTGVRQVAFSVQSQHTKATTLSPESLRDFKLAAEGYPDDCDFLLFGTGSLARMNQMASLVGAKDGKRRVWFANVDAYASAAFFRMRPYGNRAPAGWTQGDVLKHNVELYLRYADAVLDHRSSADARRVPPTPAPR